MLVTHRVIKRVRIFIEDVEWYPVPKPYRSRKKDDSALVSEELLLEYEEAVRKFWNTAKKLNTAYYKALGN